MPRGRPRKVVIEEDDLAGKEALLLEIAAVIEESVCSIPGCIPRFHLEDARRVYKKIVNLGLIRE